MPGWPVQNGRDACSLSPTLSVQGENNASLENIFAFTEAGHSWGVWREPGRGRDRQIEAERQEWGGTGSSSWVDSMYQPSSQRWSHLGRWGLLMGRAAAPQLSPCCFSLFKLQKKRGKVSRVWILWAESVQLAPHALSVKSSSTVGQNSQDLFLLAGSLLIGSPLPGIYSLTKELDIIKRITSTGWMLNIKNSRKQGRYLSLVINRTLNGRSVLCKCVPECVCSQVGTTSQCWKKSEKVIGLSSCL